MDNFTTKEILNKKLEKKSIKNTFRNYMILCTLISLHIYERQFEFGIWNFN